MKKLSEYTLNKAVNYHIDNKIPFTENVFRPHSEMSNKLFLEAKKLYSEGVYTPHHWIEEEILQGDIGEFGLYENEMVPLDFPLQEAEYKGKEVELESPKRGGSKKFYVYVKNEKGNVIKVEWGDTTGLDVKINDEGARKSFVARHKCSEKKDKTKAGYWACRTPYYADELGLSGGGKFFW